MVVWKPTHAMNSVDWPAQRMLQATAPPSPPPCTPGNSPSRWEFYVHFPHQLFSTFHTSPAFYLQTFHKSTARPSPNLSVWLWLLLAVYGRPRTTREIKFEWKLLLRNKQQAAQLPCTHKSGFGQIHHVTSPYKRHQVVIWNHHWVRAHKLISLLITDHYRYIKFENLLNTCNSKFYLS